MSCGVTLLGEVIGGLCRLDGVGVFMELEDVLLSGIKSNIERHVSPVEDAELVKKLQEDNTNGENKEEEEEKKSVRERKREDRRRRREREREGE